MDTAESHLAQLKSPDTPIRVVALISLARLGKDAADVVPGLIHYGSEVVDRQELGVLVQTLGAIGDSRAVPFLIATLEGNPDAKVGQCAANSLGQIGDDSALSALCAARHAPNHLVRSAARAAAATIADRRGHPA